MASSLDALKARVESLLGDHLESATIDRGELTIVCSAPSIAVSCQLLRDQAGFDQCIDLCGMDYSTYRDGLHDGPAGLRGPGRRGPPCRRRLHRWG